jgi:3'-phosphoadenosine 5'-phosphosulfate sulfotransferase (PAPS reductase)/FAD synthetase
MSTHSAYDLKQMQSLPLEVKIRMTQRRIRDWYDYWNGDVYVSFSGGKDSTVLKHIVDGMYDDVPAVFVNTGLEYPEIQQFVREIKDGKYDCFNSNVEMVRPKMRFDEVIKEYGYPVISKAVAHNVAVARRNPDGKVAKNIMFNPDRTGLFNHYKWNFLINAPFLVSEKCCDVMKKKPSKKYAKETGRKVILGTMAHESKTRYSSWLKNGCNAFDSSNPSSQPMSFWTEQDVLHYIKRFDVPYCPVYGEIRVKRDPEVEENQINLIDYLGDYEPEDTLETTGCTRTGCMFCMFGCHLEKEPNRFQQMKITHPKQYGYCMDKLGLKEVLEYIGVPYE